MKQFILLAFLFLGCMASTFAQDEMALMVEASMPGEEHAFLKRMEGDWFVTNSMTAPDGKTQTTTGKATKKMILGGRYLQESLNGKMMGMDVSGQNLFAYDNLTQKYRICYIDNFGTGFMLGEGQRENNQITILATSPDPAGGPDQQYKLVYTAESEEKHSMEMWMITPKGEEIPQMQISYSKKK